MQFNVKDAAALIRKSGVRDFVEFKNSGYNQVRKPGTRSAPALRSGPAAGGAELECLSEESSSERGSPLSSPPPAAVVRSAPPPPPIATAGNSEL